MKTKQKPKRRSKIHLMVLHRPVISFTGTRTGLTDDQIVAAKRLLKRQDPSELHHGCAKGGDEQLVSLVCNLGWEGEVSIIAHPAMNVGSWTSGPAMAASTKVLKAKPPLERNLDLAIVCDWLLACPKEFYEEQRSGTWATIRRAIKLRRMVKIIWPDGRLEERKPVYHGFQLPRMGG
jgi:hypothetical protein